MKIPKLIASICAILYIVSAAVPVRAASPEESFRKSFPKIRADGIRPAGVQGLYEVVSGSRILYYVPGPEYLIYGPMVTREGRNLTEERVLEILEQGLKKVPLEKAIRIGAGPHQVIEITDPDCTVLPTGRPPISRGKKRRDPAYLLLTAGNASQCRGEGPSDLLRRGPGQGL